MRKIFLLLALASAGFAYGQSARPTSGTIASSSSNQGPGNVPMIGGSFEVLKTSGSSTLHYEYNYMLYPRPFNTVINFDLSTASPLVLSGKIVDASGKVVENWTPGNVGYRYKHSFNVANYSVGNYHFDIYDENNTKVYSIPFEKTSK